jgi:molybdopterin/thiamine biosynthesis adenylyltransferase
VDPDIVDPSTAVRWPYGLNVAGQYKVGVLAGVIGEQYPYTDVVASLLRIGAVRTAGLSHRDLLDDLLRGTSLVYDATADWAVQRFLSSEAAKRNVPYVAVSGTHGGWGGTVLRIRPGNTSGCWLCWRLNDALPVPAEKANDRLQPPGCAEPTFTAAGFDMVELAMQGVRMSISTLSDGRADGYPASAADVISMSLRDEGGTQLQPAISTAALPKHPGCPSCFSRTR